MLAPSIHLHEARNPMPHTRTFTTPPLASIKPATITYITSTGAKVTLSAGVLINRRALGV